LIASVFTAEIITMRNSSEISDIKPEIDFIKRSTFASDPVWKKTKQKQNKVGKGEIRR